MDGWMNEMCGGGEHVLAKKSMGNFCFILYNHFKFYIC